MDTYNLADVTFIMGAIPLNGTKGEGGFVTIEPDDDAFKTKKAADGTVTRYATGNRIAHLTVFAGQKSGISTILSLFHQVDINASNGAGVVPALISDANSLDVFVAAESWVVKMPSSDYKEEPGDREWPIDAVWSVWLAGT